MQETGTTVSADERQAVEQLVFDTFWLVDHGQADQVPRLCAPGFTMEALGMVLDLDTFTATMAQRVDAPYESRHLVSNFRAERLPDGRLSARYHVVAHRTDSPDPLVPQAISDWTDVYVSDGEGGWLISSRRIELALQTEAAPS